MAIPETPMRDSPVGGFVQRVLQAYVGAAALTPSDSTDIKVSALIVGSSGDVKVTCLDGTTPTLHLLAGVLYPIMVTRVWLTGTTAETILGLY